MNDRYKPWAESIIDTTIAFVINFPINLLLLWLCQRAHVSIVNTGIILSVTFTFVAVIRKVVVRNYFKKKLNW